MTSTRLVGSVVEGMTRERCRSEPERAQAMGQCFHVKGQALTAAEPSLGSRWALRWVGAPGLQVSNFPDGTKTDDLYGVFSQYGAVRTNGLAPLLARRASTVRALLRLSLKEPLGGLSMDREGARGR